MSEHLSAGQIAGWTAGERSPELECHLRECAACRSQIDEFQTVLAGFRSSVRGWTEAQYAASKRPAWRPESTPRVQPRLYWAAAAALCALIALLVSHGSAPFSGEAHSSTTDAALMRQVDTEVSQTVPDAMAPLMKLVSWDGSPATEGMPESKQSAKEEE